MGLLIFTKVPLGSLRPCKTVQGCLGLYNYLSGSLKLCMACLQPLSRAFQGSLGLSRALYALLGSLGLCAVLRCSLRLSRALWNSPVPSKAFQRSLGFSRALWGPIWLSDAISGLLVLSKAYVKKYKNLLEGSSRLSRALLGSPMLSRHSKVF